MIRSMTAFCEAEKVQDDIRINVEIRSVNSRYLEVILRVPQNYTSFEDNIKALVSERLNRGRVEVRLQIKDNSEEACQYEVNEAKAHGYYNALVQLKDLLQINSDIHLNFLSNVNGILRPVDVKPDLDLRWQLIQECMRDALDGLNSMRKIEGDHMAADFKQRLAAIEQCVETIEEKANQLLPYYQERLKERIAALTHGLVEIDPARIAQESAFLADRSDITEEIVRVKSHISQFRTIMDAPEPAGRKLNFLLQELNREFNTMGSKSGDATLSHHIVDLKSELEKIREQVQNVE